MAAGLLIFALTRGNTAPVNSDAQSSNPPKASSSTEPDTPEPTADSSEEISEISDEMATVSLQNEQEGTATQIVRTGDRLVAEITIPFKYERKKGQAVITEVGEATARNISGWVHVNSAVTIDRDKTMYAKDGAKAVIYVTYEASVGSGFTTYDDSIQIDLTNL